jgi:hypothetical protein
MVRNRFVLNIPNSVSELATMAAAAPIAKIAAMLAELSAETAPISPKMHCEIEENRQFRQKVVSNQKGVPSHPFLHFLKTTD